MQLLPPRHPLGPQLQRRQLPQGPGRRLLLVVVVVVRAGLVPALPREPELLHLLLPRGLGQAALPPQVRTPRPLGLLAEGGGELVVRELVVPVLVELVQVLHDEAHILGGDGGQRPPEHLHDLLPLQEAALVRVELLEGLLGGAARGLQVLRHAREHVPHGHGALAVALGVAEEVACPLGLLHGDLELFVRHVAITVRVHHDFEVLELRLGDARVHLGNEQVQLLGGQLVVLVLVVLHEELLEPRLPLLEVLLHEGEDIRGRHRKGRGLTHYAPIGVSGLHLVVARGLVRHLDAQVRALLPAHGGAVVRPPVRQGLAPRDLDVEVDDVALVRHG
mmetsp:Transcript_58799/g.187695  ORF Transcript_58799/g.187695 Transcript_58799/m.187695 type:complete len:334 (-) Transcript_58799:1245-2246(-)